MSTYKIYKIIADAPDGRFLCYIGSTKKNIHERLARHEVTYRHFLNGKFHNITSFNIISRPWYEISLIEDLGDIDRKQAEKIEGKYITQYRQDNDYIVVNKTTVGRTKKQYYEDNKEQIKQFYQDNKEQIKQYNKANKEKIKEKKKQYNSIKHDCPCGGRYSMDYRASHYKTIKHLSYINSLN